MVRDKIARKHANLEILIGLLGFFAAVLLVATVVVELRGEPALGWSMALLAVVLGLAIAIYARRKL